MLTGENPGEAAVGAHLEGLKRLWQGSSQPGKPAAFFQEPLGQPEKEIEKTAECLSHTL